MYHISIINRTIFLLLLLYISCNKSDEPNCVQNLIITTYQGIKKDSLIKYNSNIIIGYIYKVKNLTNKYLLHTCITYKKKIFNYPFRTSIKKNGFFGLPFLNITTLSNNASPLEQKSKLNNPPIASPLLIQNKNTTKFSSSNLEELNTAFFKKRLLTIKKVRKRISLQKNYLKPIINTLTNSNVIEWLEKLSIFQYQIGYELTKSLSHFIIKTKQQVGRFSNLISPQQSSNKPFKYKTIMWNNLSYSYIKEWITYANHKLKIYQQNPYKILLN